MLLHSCGPSAGPAHTDGNLTDTFAGPPGETGTVVALQAPLAVAGKPVAAGLPQLPGTHRAAPAAIRHQGHSWRALGGRGGAETGPVTQLGPHLMEHTGQVTGKRCTETQRKAYRHTHTAHVHVHVHDHM